MRAWQNTMENALAYRPKVLKCWARWTGDQIGQNFAIWAIFSQKHLVTVEMEEEKTWKNLKGQLCFVETVETIPVKNFTQVI